MFTIETQEFPENECIPTGKSIVFTFSWRYSKKKRDRLKAELDASIQEERRLRSPADQKIMDAAEYFMARALCVATSEKPNDYSGLLARQLHISWLRKD